ncbi:MAG: glutamate--tRNA ligase, partial [Pseudomonadota bacterium]
LGGTSPRFAHHSLLTGPQGEGLSKRLGTLALRDMRERGVEPMAILSLLARLGSSDPVEIRGSVDELIEGFDITRFGAAPTKFDADDLGPLTARVVAALPYEAMAGDISALGVPDAIAAQFWDTVRENVDTRAGIAEWWTLFRDGATPQVADEDREFVAQAFDMLPPLPYGPETWSEWTRTVKDATGRKGRGLFMPLRHAITGRQRGPEMADVMPLLQTAPRLS